MNEIIETKVVDAKVVTALDYAKQLVIENDEICKEAIDYEQGLSALMKEIEGAFRPTLKKMDDARDGLFKEMTGRLKPVEEAKKLIKSKRIDYDEEQERIRKAEEIRIQAEARRLAEEAALAAALAAEKAGDGAEADAIINEPVHVPVITLQKTTPSAGISGAIREVWAAEVYDLHALVCAIVEGKASIGDVEPNMTALNGQARALKSNLNKPGVKAVSRKV